VEGAAYVGRTGHTLPRKTGARGRLALEQNVGFIDRYIRITLGGLMIAAGAARLARDGGLAGAAVGLLGGMMLAEGVLGTCPLYSVAGINTNPDPIPGTYTNDVIQPYEGI